MKQKNSECSTVFEQHRSYRLHSNSNCFSQVALSIFTGCSTHNTDGIVYRQTRADDVVHASSDDIVNGSSKPMHEGKPFWFENDESSENNILYRMKRTAFRLLPAFQTSRPRVTGWQIIARIGHRLGYTINVTAINGIKLPMFEPQSVAHLCSGWLQWIIHRHIIIKITGDEKSIAQSV